MPILLALDAQLELRCGSRTRCWALDEFYLGYRRTALQPGELITAVRVPRPHPQLRCASYKIAKRFDQDISAVCAGVAVTLDGETIVAARLAFGGMAAIPARAPAAEAALTGRRWSESWDAAAAALVHDFQPLSDQRASSQYRLQAAGNLLRRFQLEHAGGGACSRLQDVRVPS